MRVQNDPRLNTAFCPTDTRTYFCVIKRAGACWCQIKITACVMNVQSFSSLPPAQFYLCGYTVIKIYTVEFHLSRLIGTTIHPDMQKIRIIGFFFENRLRWQFEVENISTNGCFRLHIYLRTYKILIHNSLYVFDKWGKILAIKGCRTITVRKCLPEGTSRSSGYLAVQITSVRTSGVLLYVPQAMSYMSDTGTVL